MTEPERPVVRRRQRRTAWKSREQLLRAATREFVAHGFAGARIGRIVKKAGSNPRMIYHYFGSKSQLYVAVLEEALGGLRKQELQIDVAGLDPQKGLLQLFDFIAGHFESNDDLVRLLTAENLLKAKYMRKSSRIPEMSSPVLTMIEQLIERGKRTGHLSKRLDGLRLYILMVALSQFHMSNVHTLSTIFGEDLADPLWRRERRNDARHMVELFLKG
ncbi:MAG TPA: TetR/AcrR family transcriptional regulator [Xanthobacteraceae bacterium]|nr:TetR/AcrR family transcriptional regulator [Xanthobacteraceae bacterium]